MERVMEALRRTPLKTGKRTSPKLSVSTTYPVANPSQVTMGGVMQSSFPRFKSTDFMNCVRGYE